MKTGSKKEPCSICQKLVASYYLSTHVKIHQGNYPFKCDVCEKGFSCKSNLESHERIHTGEKPFKCTYCKMSFRNKACLMGHTRLHTGEKEPRITKECPICQKILDQGSISCHMRTHTGVKPYQCEICEKTFTQKVHLDGHRNSVHLKIQLFKCDVCGKGCRDKGVLNAHMLIHTGEKPHECKYCGKAFRQRGPLIKHERIHTGEKPFHCQYCEKTFSRKKNQNEHERVHTGEKPYQCGICSKSYRQSNHLKEHMRTHNHEVKLGCHLCPAVFLRKKSVGEHIRMCQIKARLSLIEDGMNEEEAALAVEPPLNAVGSGGVIAKNDLDSSIEDEPYSPKKLKKCSIRLKRFWYIELAVEKGCRAVLLPKNRNFKPKPIW